MTRLKFEMHANNAIKNDAFYIYVIKLNAMRIKFPIMYLWILNIDYRKLLQIVLLKFFFTYLMLM